jgi:hypothetical protein
VAQGGLELTIFLPRSDNAGIIGTYHHAVLYF